MNTPTKYSNPLECEAVVSAYEERERQKNALIYGVIVLLFCVLMAAIWWAAQVPGVTECLQTNGYEGGDCP